MRRIFLVGLGSLARRLIHEVIQMPEITDVVVLSRSSAGASWCSVCTLVSSVTVHFEHGDALDYRTLSDLLIRYKPDLVIQTGSLMSPFALWRHPRAQIAEQAGFGLHLPAQIPVALACMRAARDRVPETPVINCSFPDAVNPILSGLGLAPEVGIGNVSIIQTILAKQLFGGDPGGASFDVVAHHSQVGPFLSTAARERVLPPVVILERDRHRELAPTSAAVSYTGEEINLLTARTAIPVIRGLLSLEKRVALSAPGPSGLAGGYPVVIESGKLALRLPDRFPLEEATRRLKLAARFDGIEHIDSAGTVHFTDEFARAVQPLCAELAAPLQAQAAMDRFQVLSAALH